MKREEKTELTLLKYKQNALSLNEAKQELLNLHSVSNRRKLLIATIEKVRYNLDGYGALSSSEIAERLEKAINCC